MADTPSTLLIAHRGESHDAPENTLAAFDLAWQLGAAAIELDVYLTTDGKLICCHDATTNRTSGGKTNLILKDQSLATLQAIDVGAWKDPKYAGERIPTLDEVLESVPPGKKVFVEIKVGVEAIPELKNVLRRIARPSQEVSVICFKIEVCRAAKRELPDHPVLWLVSQSRDGATRLSSTPRLRPEGSSSKSSSQWEPTVDEMIATARDAGVDGVEIDDAKDPVTRETIQRFRQAGLLCMAWTIDDPIRVRELIDAEVDAVTTNRANWMRRQLSQLSSAPR